MDSKAELVEAIHFLHSQGWAPATSSNYSFRERDEAFFQVSQSGIDKGAFSTAHFITVDGSGQNLTDERKPSAETLLHSLIYRLYPEATCILHTHSLVNTVISQYLQRPGVIILEQYELLKAFEGVSTHDIQLHIPIFANSQDIPLLATTIETHILAQENQPKAFLIAGHGMYTWASTIALAKRQVEAIEFLLACEWMKLAGQITSKNIPTWLF